MVLGNLDEREKKITGIDTDIDCELIINSL
jgi:hypothetical protein